MPKRFTATEKWTDPWFCGLTDNEKLFWLYLLDNCNHAGIWEPNWFMFGVYVKNFKFNPAHFEGRIFIVGKKWHIPKFIEFQYGKLNPDNRAHASVISLLEKEGPSKPLTSPLLGAKDMVKVKSSSSLKEELHKDKIIDNKGPVNWDNCRTDLQRVVAAYVRVSTPALYKPGACTQAQATAIFKQQGKAVGPILEQCGNVDTAIRVIELAAGYYLKKGLDWSLYAVSKNCIDYLNIIEKEKNYGANR